MDPIGMRALNPRCYPAGYLLIRPRPRPRTIRRSCAVSDTAGNKPRLLRNPTTPLLQLHLFLLEKEFQILFLMAPVVQSVGSICQTSSSSVSFSSDTREYRINCTNMCSIGCWPASCRQQDGDKRLLAFTKRGLSIHSDFSYRRGDWLVFGSETRGLPPEALEDCRREELGGGTIRIPMVETYVRCLNLSVSVASLYMKQPGS
uniref:tRNA/rRNA methyltransferase SpoU type domain-containing protein n=1 Tax=Ananas comosus var. bracteatus TaxID=296719 RepID=A0A6V7QX81_ANACO